MPGPKAEHPSQGSCASTTLALGFWFADPGYGFTSQGRRVLPPVRPLLLRPARAD
jgi:hypothetical protein